MQTSGLIARLLGRPTAPSVRPFPYPYSAAVAISNDCEFMTWRDYLEIYRYLNRPAGLGLEVGTSLFFFVTNALCHSSFGYFRDLRGEPSPEAPLIREMVHAGYIDTIHAYGDFDEGGFERRHAEAVLRECERHDLRFPFWTNHGSNKNSQNLGHVALDAYQGGDRPDSPSYHLDLLRQMGTEAFWVDDGYQDAVADGTPLLYQAAARDGSTLHLVRRYRGLTGKPAPNAGQLAEQITASDLDRLVEREEACIYYQHLGVREKTDRGAYIANQPPYFDQAGASVLEHLASLYRGGDCLVTTPGRLIRYLTMRDAVELEADGDEVVVRSASVPLSVEALAGLTLSVERPVSRVVWQDEGGRRSELEVSTEYGAASDETTLFVPWKRLPEFAW